MTRYFLITLSLLFILVQASRGQSSGDARLSVRLAGVQQLQIISTSEDDSRPQRISDQLEVTSIGRYLLKVSSVLPAETVSFDDEEGKIEGASVAKRWHCATRSETLTSDSQAIISPKFGGVLSSLLELNSVLPTVALEGNESGTVPILMYTIEAH